MSYIDGRTFVVETEDNQNPEAQEIIEGLSLQKPPLPIAALCTGSAAVFTKSWGEDSELWNSLQHRSPTNSNRRLALVETMEHRRFIEFCHACRRYGHHYRVLCSVS